MIIEINDNDKDDVLNALNKGIVALNDVQGHFIFGLEIPKKWSDWQKKKGFDDEEACIEINKSLNILEAIYKQIKNLT